MRSSASVVGVVEGGIGAAEGVEFGRARPGSVGGVGTEIKDGETGIPDRSETGDPGPELCTKTGGSSCNGGEGKGDTLDSGSAGPDKVEIGGARPKSTNSSEGLAGLPWLSLRSRLGTHRSRRSRTPRRSDPGTGVDDVRRGGGLAARRVGVDTRRPVSDLRPGINEDSLLDDIDGTRLDDVDNRENLRENRLEES